MKAPRTLQVELPAKDHLFVGKKPTIAVGPEVTVFVGPNGSGKTQTLRALAGTLAAHIATTTATKVHFLAAGRASPFERFRSRESNPNGLETDNAHVGHAAYRERWWDLESITGGYLALEQRADLRLKVQVRLQAFLARTIEMRWGQGGLEVRFAPDDGRPSFAANHEASGLLQIAPLLAAIYNDEIGALIIDEPEVSLHPQYQSFIMHELRSVAGDPAADRTKKFVIIATHSPSMLSVQSVNDLPSVVFFHDVNTLPVQMVRDAPELKSKKLRALVYRLTATHRLAFFARNVLLVEGPSDEIITSQLSLALQHPLLPANTQIVPVIGKSEFAEAIKLFELMGKEVFVLADLDALTDSTELINQFNTKLGADQAAAANGHASVMHMDRGLRSDFAKAVTNHWEAIKEISTMHHYWTDCPEAHRAEDTKIRCTLASLMSDGPAAFDRVCDSQEFTGLHHRFSALFGVLARVGCFFLQRGTIEDYHQDWDPTQSKIEAAATEAALFPDADKADLEIRYSDVLLAIRSAAPLKPVDENQMLRERIGGALGSIFQSAQLATSSDEINGKARSAHPDAGIFEFVNRSTREELRILVGMNSPLFVQDCFPFELSINDNLHTSLLRHLPKPE